MLFFLFLIVIENGYHVWRAYFVPDTILRYLYMVPHFILKTEEQPCKRGIITIIAILQLE